MILKRGYDNDLIDFEINTCETQGELFGDCQFYDKYPCNAGDFIVKFMSSYIAADMDGDLSPYHTWGTQQLFDEMFLAFDSIGRIDEILDPDMMYWIGYITRYWTWWLGTPSRVIIESCTFEFLCKVYPFHTLGPQEAILKIMEAKSMSI